MFPPIRSILIAVFMFVITAATVSAQTGSITLAWDPNDPSEQVTEYWLHYKTGTFGPPYDGTGLYPKDSPNPVDSPIIIRVADLADQNNPRYSLTGLTAGVTYRFTTTAYNGSHSRYSNEVSYLFQEPVELHHIEITGPVSVNENSSANYTCTAHYTDGSNVPVTATSWSETCSQANISSAGQLTTGEVTADTSCTVSATFTSGSITRSDEINITIEDIVSLHHIEITGPNRVNENSSANYTCTAHYTDGSNVPVTATSWSETCSQANISSAGQLTTGEVTADTSCTVSATFTSGSITRSDEINITIEDIVSLHHIEITGLNRVNENSSVNYNCIAHYTDGSNVQVAATSWSETCPVTNISSDGQLTTGEVNSDTPCTVSATYTSEGITRSDEINITIENTSIVRLDHIEIAGPSHVNENSSVNYNCIAYYTDGSNEQATAESWSDTCPGTTVSNDGQLTTGEVSDDTSCRVSAIYTSEGITKSNGMDITIENTSIVMLDYIEIAGPDSVDENSSANYNCIAYYTDGSNEQVTAESWNETCPGTTVSNNGRLTTGEVNVDNPCAVSATYTSEGIMRSDEINITIENTSKDKRTKTNNLFILPILDLLL